MGGLIANCGDKKCKIGGSPGPSPTPGGKSTCAKLGCGNHDTTCWCNKECKQHGSCCPDYDAVCPPSPAKKSTCATLKCGNHDSTCWCNTECKKHNSCCPDYDSVCPPGTNLMATNSSRLEFV